jgi:hypothetical protein
MFKLSDASELGRFRRDRLRPIHLTHCKAKRRQMSVRVMNYFSGPGMFEENFGGEII